MCMMLYIGSDIPLPIIPFKEDAPAFHTEVLTENDEKIVQHFSTANVSYAGSSQGCGCGFQHSLIDSNIGWLNVEDEDDDDFKMNMRQLYEYVKDVVGKGGKVELYACWDGEFEDAPMSREDISLQELINKQFYLKEKGFYIVR
jgi:hypothetical protein